MSKLDKCVLDEKLAQLLAWYATPNRLMTNELVGREGELEAQLKEIGFPVNELWALTRPVREGANS